MAGLDHCLTGYHNTEYLTDGIKSETDYVNQFHKLINKTKDIEFGSEYQFTLRLLEKKRKCKELTRRRKLKATVGNKYYGSQLI